LLLKDDSTAKIF